MPSAKRLGGSFFDMITGPIAASLDCVFRDVDCVSMDSPRRMEEVLSDEVCGVVVSGSPALLSDGEEWMRWTMEALARLHARGVPLLGICFGHQLLGQALGGQVNRNPKGREIGTFRLRRQAKDPLLDGVRAEPIVVMTHVDSVLTCPEGATPIASTSLEGHAALRFSDTTWGVQFHPEMNAALVGCYLEERRSTIEQEGTSVDALLQARTDSQYGSELLVRFADFCLNGGRFV